MVIGIILVMFILLCSYQVVFIRNLLENVAISYLDFLNLVLQATLREEKKLRVENAKLKKEIEELKQELIQAEIQNGGN